MLDDVILAVGPGVGERDLHVHGEVFGNGQLDRSTLRIQMDIPLLARCSHLAHGDAAAHGSRFHRSFGSADRDASTHRRGIHRTRGVVDIDPPPMVLILANEATLPT